jgi:hypothetical protein
MRVSKQMWNKSLRNGSDSIHLNSCELGPVWPLRTPLTVDVIWRKSVQAPFQN